MMNERSTQTWDATTDLADATEAVAAYDVTEAGLLWIEWADGNEAVFGDIEAAIAMINRMHEHWQLLSDREREAAIARRRIKHARRDACEWLGVDAAKSMTVSGWGSAYITLRCGRVVRLSDHAPTGSSRGEHHVEIYVDSAALNDRASLRREVAQQLRASR